MDVHVPLFVVFFVLFFNFPENLRMESPDYVKLIETRSDISSLLVPQKLKLCTSVFQSPYYEWRQVTSKNNGSLIKVVHKRVPLIFKKIELIFKRFDVNVTICEVTLQDDQSRIFGLIQSYNNDNSLIVVAGTSNEVYLDVYVKNIPSLDE